MADVQKSQTDVSESMKMKTGDIAFGVIALIAIAALVMYMN